jgi:hypothetical protein
MANFPALVPAPFEFTPGDWPSSTVPAMDGRSSRVRLGNSEVGRDLPLTFPNLTEADYLAIVAHYRGQRSGFDPFAFATATLPSSYTPAGHAWRYVGPPQIEDRYEDVFSVSCQFRSQPYGLVQLHGATWRSAATTLAPGAMSDGKTPFSHGVALTSPATALVPGQFTAGALWSPTSLPGLELFLDYTNTAARTLVSGAISQQDDESGNGRHASQATAGKRPTPGTGIAGRDCMTTTAGQYLELATSLATVRTLIIAAEFTDPDAGYQFLVGAAGTYDWHSGPNGPLLLGTSAAATVTGGSGWITGAATAPVAMTRRREVTLFEFVTTAAATIGQFSADRSNGFGDRGLIGNHYAVIACSGVLSSENRWKLEGWLAHRLSIAGDLPAAHPYRSILPLA